MSADQTIMLAVLVPLFFSSGIILIARDLPPVKRWLGES